jgi:hypothetical protein
MSKELVNLEAAKRFRYRTRMLTPGEAFQASPRDAQLLVGIKRARIADRVPGVIPPPPKAVADAIAGKPVPDPALPGLRAEYAEKLGKRAYPGWDADELRRRIAEAANA